MEQRHCMVPMTIVHWRTGHCGQCCCKGYLISTQCSTRMFTGMQVTRYTISRKLTDLSFSPNCCHGNYGEPEAVVNAGKEVVAEHASLYVVILLYRNETTKQ